MICTSEAAAAGEGGTRRTVRGGGGAALAVGLPEGIRIIRNCECAAAAAADSLSTFALSFPSSVRRRGVSPVCGVPLRVCLDVGASGVCGIVLRKAG